MSLIVAGHFDTFDQAQSAARLLHREGFSDRDVSIFFVMPPGQHDTHPAGGDVPASSEARRSHIGAGVGVAVGAAVGCAVGLVVVPLLDYPIMWTVLPAATGAYVGSFVGALSTARFDPKSSSSEARSGLQAHPSGVVLAVHVQPDTQDRAAQVLKRLNGCDVQGANGIWRQGEWKNFDPIARPNPSASTVGRGYLFAP